MTGLSVFWSGVGRGRAVWRRACSSSAGTRHRLNPAPLVANFARRCAGREAPYTRYARRTGTLGRATARGIRAGLPSPALRHSLHPHALKADLAALRAGQPEAEAVVVAFALALTWHARQHIGRAWTFRASTAWCRGFYPCAGRFAGCSARLEIASAVAGAVSLTRLALSRHDRTRQAVAGLRPLFEPDPSAPLAARPCPPAVGVCALRGHRWDGRQCYAAIG